MRSLLRAVAVAGLATVLALPIATVGNAGEFFEDVPDTHTFFEDISWLGVTGITRGCNPPTNDHFCPDDYVTRGQMAAFLVRALDLSDTGAGDLFEDDDGSVFESDIDKLGTAGVTRGCNPPENTRYCPDSLVTRGQMSAFLHRALGGGILGGHVFEDADLDGMYDPAESPLQGITVYLTGTTITRRSAVSDVRGEYAFGSLDPGEYMVEIPAEAVPPGSLVTSETWSVVDVSRTTARLDLDFGLRTPHGFEQSLVGDWAGTNSNPWVDSYAIEIEFGSDGVYSSHTDAENWALYFGPDDDTPLKTYAVTNVGPDTVGSGEIAFVWLGNIPPTVRMGAMTAIGFLGPDHVTIEIWDRGRYGPVVLDLVRSGA